MVKGKIKLATEGPCTSPSELRCELNAVQAPAYSDGIWIRIADILICQIELYKMSLDISREIRIFRAYAVCGSVVVSHVHGLRLST